MAADSRTSVLTASLTATAAPQFTTAALLPVSDGFEYCYFTAPMVHEGRNNNGDIFSRAELASAWASIIGMPLDCDHDLSVDGIVGSFVDASFVNAAPGGVIQITAAINKTLYPQTAWKVESGILTGISMECLFERGEQNARGRQLHGVRFVGGGLTRMPADPLAIINQVAPHLLAASRRRRSLLLAAGLFAAERLAA